MPANALILAAELRSTPAVGEQIGEQARPRRETSMNMRLAAWGSNVDVADLVADDQGDPLEAFELVLERPWHWASARSATSSVAVRKITRWPVRQARIESAIARWVLPVPAGRGVPRFCGRAGSRARRGAR